MDTENDDALKKISEAGEAISGYLKGAKEAKETGQREGLSQAFELLTKSDRELERLADPYQLEERQDFCKKHQLNFVSMFDRTGVAFGVQAEEEFDIGRGDISKKYYKFFLINQDGKKFFYGSVGNSLINNFHLIPEKLMDFREGLAFDRTTYSYTDFSGQQIDYRTPNPNWKVTPQGPFCGGLARVKIEQMRANNLDDGYGFVDKTGSLVFTGQGMAGDFSEGFTKVAVVASWVSGEYTVSYYDPSGKLLSMKAPACIQGTNFENGLAIVRNREKIFVIDKQGDIVRSFDGGSIIISKKLNSGVTIFYRNDDSGRGILDLDGNLTPLPKGRYGDFSEGIVVFDEETGVRLDGTAIHVRGYIDKSGNKLFGKSFIYALDFYQGVAIVSDDGKNYYAINHKGKEVFRF